MNPPDEHASFIRPPGPPVALVLSGGGARGAYEAGIIRYLREELPLATRNQVRFDILCGTSVGAVTACFLAATMDTPDRQGQLLCEMWTDLSLEKVYKVEGENLWSLTRKMWRAATNEPVRSEGWRLYDILHPEPLEEMVRTRPPWPRISANLARGLFSALAVTATEIASGNSVVFVQRKEGGVPPWSRDPYTEARATIIGPEHAVASAAIPLLFRSVKIGDEFFCDGSLRQSMPLGPALRLGGQKILLISLKYRPPGEKRRSRALAAYPTTPLLMGKVLNARETFWGELCSENQRGGSAHPGSAVSVGGGSGDPTVARHRHHRRGSRAARAPRQDQRPVVADQDVAPNRAESARQRGGPGELPAF